MLLQIQHLCLGYFVNVLCYYHIEEQCIKDLSERYKVAAQKWLECNGKRNRSTNHLLLSSPMFPLWKVMTNGMKHREY